MLRTARHFVSIFLALLLLAVLSPRTGLAEPAVWDGSIATAFAGGTGTETNPYKIADGAQLTLLAKPQAEAVQSRASRAHMNISRRTGLAGR